MPNDESAMRQDAPQDTEAADWQRFLTPESGAAFLEGWLALALRRISGARGGVLFLRGEGDAFGIAARQGIDAEQLGAVQDFATRLSREPQAQIEARPDGGALAGYPVLADGTLQALLVVDVAPRNAAALRAVLREMHWVTGWIDARLWQGRAALRSQQVATARLVLDLLAAADEHPRFHGAALALVNALPRLTGFDGAAIGMMRRGRVRLEALSDSATFERRAETVREIEAAMDEAIAQDDAVHVPPPEGGTRIDLAHRRLATRLGAGAILTVPLPVRGAAVGALLLEKARADETPVALDRDAVEQSRLAAAAIAPVLKLKLDDRRWISGRGRDLLGRGATAVLGRRPAMTLAAMVLVAAVAAVFIIRAPMRIAGDAALEGREQRAAVSLVDGFLREARVKAGDEVRAGDVLVTFDDRDLQLELDRAEAAEAQAQQAVRSALSEGDRAAAAKARAELDEAAAARALALARIARLTVTAPIDGLVVSGDLSQRLGAPVSRGEVLFEIARLDAYRIRIDVSEYDLAPVRSGQTGSLVLNALPGQPVPFEVVTISSVSEPGDAENRFRLEARVTDLPAAARPGMEGVAKIDTGEASLAWIWFRGTVRRAQLFLWRWLP